MGEIIYKVKIFEDQTPIVYKKLIDYALCKSDAFMLIARYDCADDSEYELLEEKIFYNREEYLDYLDRVKEMKKQGREDIKIFKEQTEAFLKELQPYLIKQRHTPTEWPRTKLSEDINENNKRKKPSINLYKVCEEVKIFLYKPNGIFKWIYPNFPEDLSFFKDGYCWFESCAHERFAFMYLDDLREVEMLKSLGLKFELKESEIEKVRLFYEEYYDLNKQKYTYEDYLGWTEGSYEIIEGEVYMMSPAPSRAHQEISMVLVNKIYNYLQGRKCKVYAAPFDVRLSKEGYSDEKIKTVVQPDITVICDEDKLDDKGAVGVPDFIAEIVSPSSTFMDYVKKLNLYGEYGVKEYWIVNPKHKSVLVYKTDENGVYGNPEMYSKEDTVRVNIFEDLVIDLKTIF